MFKVLRDRENILSQGMSTRYYGIKVAYVRLPRKARTAISKKYLYQLRDNYRKSLKLFRDGDSVLQLSHLNKECLVQMYH
jgi:hypothetical protein